jgi:hypothetical protein
LGVGAIVQIGYLKRAETIAAESSNAARKAAEVAERALVAVERPILIVSIPDKFAIAAERPKFIVNIENAGKQVANTNGVSVFLIIQSDSNFPIGVNAMDGSTCTTVPVVGQIVVKPGGDKDIECRRQKAITTEEVAGVSNGTLYAFFKVSIIYVDPLGNDRVSDWIGLLRPSGKFVQVFSADAAKPLLLTSEQQQQNQRALVDTMLQIERKRGYPLPDE